MVYIENEGAIFRGPALAWPEEVWNAQDNAWEAYAGETPKPMGWGREITGEEAKALIEPETNRE